MSPTVDSLRATDDGETGRNEIHIRKGALHRIHQKDDREDRVYDNLIDGSSLIHSKQYGLRQESLREAWELEGW